MPDKNIERTEPFTLPIEILGRLTEAAELTGESKDRLISQALERYLEDLEDLADAEAVLDQVCQGKEEFESLDEVMKEFGLDIRNL